MQAIVKACHAESWPARIAAVISDRPDAQGLALARNFGVATEVVNHSQYPTRGDFERALQSRIDSYTPDLIALAGFMRILTPRFVEHYAGRMLNVHPSLLPLFPGLHTHRRALAAGVKEHGATVHFVSAEVDRGAIVAQATVPVLPQDDENALAARVLEVEHRIYPRAIRRFLDGGPSPAHDPPRASETLIAENNRSGRVSF